jgi:hypothetical protein
LDICRIDQIRIQSADSSQNPLVPLSTLLDPINHLLRIVFKMCATVAARQFKRLLITPPGERQYKQQYKVGQQSGQTP